MPAPAEVTHKTIPIILLDGHPKNYRRHPPEQLARLRESLIRFSQVRSIVVQAKENGRYTIVAGHGIVAAALECGIHKLHCDIVPASWDELTIHAYLVADNELERGVDPDERVLADLLLEQQQAGYQLSALGLLQPDLDTLLQSLQQVSHPLLPQSRPFAPFPNEARATGDSEEEEEEAEEDEEDVRSSMTLPQGRVVELPGDHWKNRHGEDGVAFGRTVKEYLQQYESTMLRQIVLVFQQERYAEMIHAFTVIRMAVHLETNAEVVEFLLARYLEQHPELQEEVVRHATGERTGYSGTGKAEA